MRKVKIKLNKDGVPQPAKPMPEPAVFDARICFAIMWFKTEAEAEIAHAWVRWQDCRYNGGWYHDAPCGREPTWDREDPKLGKLFAVTT